MAVISIRSLSYGFFEIFSRNSHGRHFNTFLFKPQKFEFKKFGLLSMKTMKQVAKLFRSVDYLQFRHFKTVITT